MSLTRLAHGRERQGQARQSRHQWRHQRLSKWKQWSCRRIQINANIWVYLGSLTWHSLALRYCLEHSLSEDSWIHSCSARLEWRENRIRQNRLMMAGWCLRIVNPRCVVWPLNPGLRLCLSERGLLLLRAAVLEAVTAGAATAEPTGSAATTFDCWRGSRRTDLWSWAGTGRGINGLTCVE